MSLDFSLKDTSIINSIVVQIVNIFKNFNWQDPLEPLPQETAYGTGFFISEDILLTCCHVVSDTYNLTMLIPIIGKDKYDLEIISVYNELDIAILRVKNYKSKYWFKLGNSDNLTSQNEVVAIGYPLAQDRLKVTKGIISGIQYGNIQTDAPINPGNSGGPLIDIITSEVVGINSSKIMFADNVGYSIPINKYKKVAHQMLKTSVIYSPVYPFQYQQVDQLTLKILSPSYKDITGVLIYKTLIKDSNIQVGDILIKFDGMKVDNYGECMQNGKSEKISISELKTKYSLEDKIPVCLIRNNKIINTEIDLSRYPLKILRLEPVKQIVPYIFINGLVFMQLSINHLDIYELVSTLSKYGLTKKLSNYTVPRIIISHIKYDSPYQKFDTVEPGLIVHSVDGKKVEYLSDLYKLFIENSNRMIKFTNEKIIFIECNNEIKSNIQI